MSSITTRVSAAIPVERISPLENRETFSRLYSETHLTIFRYIYGLHGGPQEDVEDLTAETYVRAWRARESFRGDEEAALRWLLQIARHLVIDSHRRRGRRGIPDNIDDMIIPADEESPEDQTLAREQHQVLRTMIHDLSEKQREIIVMRYMLGWRVKNIAAYLEMSPNNVSVTIRRALNRMRRCWPEPGQESIQSKIDSSPWGAQRMMLDGFKR